MINKLKMKMIVCTALISLSQTVLASGFSTHQRWVSYFWEKNTSEPSVISYDWQTEAFCNEQANALLKDDKNPLPMDWSFKCNTVLSNGSKQAMILMLWKKPNPAPIMVPAIYETKFECMKQTKEFNAITLATIKKERNFNCKEIY